MIHEITMKTHLKILVVDDNHDAAQALADYLQICGYANVVVATSAEEGIAKGQAQKPHVVLMDIRMPEIDGYTAASMMRADAAFRDAIFIAVTGFGQDEDKKKSLDAGFEHHFIKPIDSHALLKLLSRINNK